MSLRSLEAAILNELKREPGCSKLRQKDIMEWRTGLASDKDFQAQAGEVAVYLTDNRVWVAYKSPEKKAGLPKTSAGSQARIDGEG